MYQTAALAKASMKSEMAYQRRIENGINGINNIENMQWRRSENGENRRNLKCRKWRRRQSMA